ncbi:MAG: hypothetical protein ABW022_14870 [Actinoplanes sp.]
MNPDSLPTYCRLERWTLVDGEPQQPSRVLGVARWEDLLALVKSSGGRSLTYDLFDIPNPDGGIDRYRAVDLL